MAFKEGDRIRAIADCQGNDLEKGKEYTLVMNGGLCAGGCNCEDKWELINNNFNDMSIISKFKLSNKPEPEKSFIKKGVMNMDGTLTTEGKELYETWQFEKNKEAFNTEVVSKIEIEQTETKKV